ncbi:toxin-antitoxin system, toxin component [Kribbella sp. NPDC026596]|uniref:LppU/SCO3897 family protein n=1 Tax=Kribbella sp. NPDC026596 TaxID=3155122 RepID=UPI0033D3358F
MTTSPPQPPQNPYPGQPGGYGPPPEQFPQYAQPQSQPETHPGHQPGPANGQQPGQGYGGQQYGQPQQAPYGQQPFQQQAPYQQGQAFPHGQQAFAPQGQQQCRFCGGYPAVDATVRGHQGMIILMRWLKLQGPFCRTCGIASVRDMTSKSLWQGWWGIGSVIINPIIMLTNIGPMQKFKSLPEPAPGPGRPMDPGKPLFQRPVILGLLIPVAVLALIIFANLNSTSNADVGQCVQNKGTSSNPDVSVVDCGSSDAEYKIVGKLDDSTDDTQCDQFAGSEASYVYERGSTKYTLCLSPV